MTCALQSGGAQPSSQRHSRLLSQTWEAQGGSEGLCALGRVSCPWPLKTPGVRNGKRAGVTGHREPAPRREWPLHQKRGRATPVSASYALGVPREVGAIITPTGQMRTLALEVSKPPGPRGKDWNCLRGPSLPPGAPLRPPSAHPQLTPCPWHLLRHSSAPRRPTDWHRRSMHTCPVGKKSKGHTLANTAEATPCSYRWGNRGSWENRTLLGGE